MLKILDSPRIYCGKEEMPKNGIYTSKGTPYDCLRKGFGAGLASVASKKDSDDKVISAVEAAKWANKLGVKLITKRGRVKDIREVVNELAKKIGGSKVIKQNKSFIIRRSPRRSPRRHS